MSTEMSSLTDIAETNISICSHGGFGVRYNCGHTCYLYGQGPGLTITVQGGKKSTFNCKDPATLEGLLREYMEGAPLLQSGVNPSSDDIKL